ncbi:hypothetical protein [Pseudomonas sputi]|uniref:hypothetical protein n=1 Tax=Pseudomonas sputi TaxID=2892325 RepID=UPI001F354418|nr:hypothetical protein [Pseudomonas sputi]
MTRIIRKVDIDSWPISDTLNERKNRLHSVPEAASLLATILAEAESAATSQTLSITWEESCAQPGFFRTNGRIPLSEDTFDLLFNGRSGYRAQYYLSPEEGILFNRDIVVGLYKAIEISYRNDPLDVPIELIRASLIAPHSKIWIYNEKAAFNEADSEALNPLRWVASGKTRGRKAPLPKHLTIDVKGSFLHPTSHKLFVDELKLDRAWDLFNSGFT